MYFSKGRKKVKKGKERRGIWTTYSVTCPSRWSPSPTGSSQMRAEGRGRRGRTEGGVVVRYAAILTRKGQFRARETKTCATKPCFSSKVAKCHSFWLLGGTGVI